MKRYKALSLLVLPLVLSGCNNEPQEDPNLVKKDIDVTMASHFHESSTQDTYVDVLSYDDHWFLEDSHNLNYQLAVASAMTGGMSYVTSNDTTGSKIASFLNEAGYTNISKNQYYETGERLDNSFGVIIGSKKINSKEGKPYTLLAIFPRNAGYGPEWAGNFIIGNSGVHKGFLEARDEYLRFMKKYIKDNNITGDMKVWAAGYSRGAAVTNLVGGYLAGGANYFGNDVAFSSNDLYVYTIGTPRTIPTGLKKSQVLNVSGPRGEGYHDTEGEAYTYAGLDEEIVLDAEQYKCVHNFVAYGDYITKLPPEQYSFSRYGEVNNITYGSDAFIANLSKNSKKTADTFKNGVNYMSEQTIRTIDLTKVDFAPTGEKITPDAMISNRVSALLTLVKTREELIEKGYADILGAVTAIFGIDYQTFFNNVKKDGMGDIIKVGLFAYLDYVVKSTKKADNQGIADFLMDFMNMLGKTVEDRSTYTDQALLKDLLDYLINDYQNNDEARKRAIRLGFVLPAPYGQLYLSFLEHAKNKQIVATTVDSLVYLLSDYVSVNNKNETVNSLVSFLGGLVPAKYLSYIPIITGKTRSEEEYPDPVERAKIIMFDLFDVFANGRYDESGKQLASATEVRYLALNMVGSLALSNYPRLLNLLINGTEAYGQKTVRDPALLADLLTDVLTLALPKDEEGKTISIKQAASDALVKLLEKGKTDSVAKYVELLEKHPEDITDILFTLFFLPGESYSLANDVKNGYTFINIIQFLFPAHYHELYIAYLRTQLPD